MFGNTTSVAFVAGALLMGALTGCHVPGRNPGSLCSQNIESEDGQCAYGFYCSQAEICTRRCESDGGCAVPCKHDWDCTMNDACVSGFCRSSLSLSCQQDSCVPNCYVDGGCDFDIYGPSRRGEENR